MHTFSLHTNSLQNFCQPVSPRNLFKCNIDVQQRSSKHLSSKDAVYGSSLFLKSSIFLPYQSYSIGETAQLIERYRLWVPDVPASSIQFTKYRKTGYLQQGVQYSRCSWHGTDSASLLLERSMCSRLVGCCSTES